MKLPLLTCLLATLALPALAETSGSLRDLSPDRPDTTESAQTLDRGHWMVEASVAAYGQDKDQSSGDKVSGWSFAEMNLKYGLSDSDDIQLILTPYGFEDSRTAGSPRDRADGMVDTVVRFKHNFWGNDEGETAFALMPFVSLPSGSRISSDHVEGGLIAPLGWSPDWAARNGLAFGFMLEGDVNWDDQDGDYDFDLVHTATCGIEIAGPLGCFIEYVGNAPTDGAYQARASFGVTYAVNANLLLDVGSRIGLNDAAEDLFVYSGFTLRH